MSELKAGVITTPHNEGMSFDRGSDAITVTEGETEFYLKSEADKVLADLEESHKMEVEQLLMEIVELKKEKEYVIEHTAEVINGQERELRRQKYKRCLDKAILCQWKMGVFIYKGEKSDFYCRWYKRWLAIAEKFKEA